MTAPWSVPTRSSVLIAVTATPVNSIPSFEGGEAGQEGECRDREATREPTSVESVTAVRNFDQTGLAAPTVTPGNTAPDVLTMPERVAWA